MTIKWVFFFFFLLANNYYFLWSAKIISRNVIHFFLHTNSNTNMNILSNLQSIYKKHVFKNFESMIHQLKIKFILHGIWNVVLINNKKAG